MQDSEYRRVGLKLLIFCIDEQYLDKFCLIDAWVLCFCRGNVRHTQAPYAKENERA